MKLTNKKAGEKIGIWGLGVSGTSLVAYLHNHPCKLSVLEKAATDQTRDFCVRHGATLYLDDTTQRQQFLHDNDIIIASPGVDLRPYQDYAHKFLAETDLFYVLWKKRACPTKPWRSRIIGITGTLGKTSITTLLATLLKNANISLATGGNIGTGMLDLLQSNAEYALLELSSFQLEHCKHFAADIAVITNLYPNHLDRHGTMEQYLAAKKEIFIRQQPGQWALAPLQLAAELRKDPTLKKRPMAFFSMQAPTDEEREHLRNDDRIYTLSFLQHIPTLSYPQNWLIIAAVLDLMGLDAQSIIAQAENLTIPDYRLEKVATIQDVSYYNDSKSTIMQATLAAVDVLHKHHHNIILLLGGTSKGVDRAPFVQHLKNSVKHVVCFGGEAEQLFQMCNAAHIPAQSVATLEEAVIAAHKHAPAQAAVVLSPGGASFDLFKDYKERGERFKQLVLSIRQ